VRVDRTWNGPLPSGASGELLTRVRTVADRISGWAFCDRGSGAAAPGAVAMLPGIRVVDSSARLATFPAVTVATLNEEGAAAFTGRSAAAEGDVRAAAKAILEKTGSENVVVTRGRLGLALFGTEGRELFLPARGTGAVDPLGAGDVVTAVLAGALTAGATPEEAATLANHAAGVAVGKTGLAVIAPRELVERICAG
jgi:D-beta-D-heptose 7-phosphate kinase/D-beta-D-heptose 1-phosphate adenosyltransferase